MTTFLKKEGKLIRILLHKDFNNSVDKIPNDVILQMF